MGRRCWRLYRRVIQANNRKVVADSGPASGAKESLLCFGGMVIVHHGRLPVVLVVFGRGGSTSPAALDFLSDHTTAQLWFSPHHEWMTICSTVRKGYLPDEFKAINGKLPGEAAVLGSPRGRIVPW